MSAELQGTTYRRDMSRIPTAKSYAEPSTRRHSFSSDDSRRCSFFSDDEDEESYNVEFYDYFLSHRQSNAQDSVHNMRLILAETLPGTSFWLDIEQAPTERGMHDGIRSSNNVILYLTEGVTQREYVQKEMRWALQYGKNIILVGETDERHGKPNMLDLIAQCPEDLKCVFADNVVIPWHRDPAFRAVSVNKIIEASVARKMFSSNTTSSGALMYARATKRVSDVEGVPSQEVERSVFDPSFVYFTSLCGVALPGAGRKTRCWAIVVRIIILACGLMCLSRLFAPFGPAFLDNATIVQLGFAHPLIFYLVHTTLSQVHSPLVQEMLEYDIGCRGEANLLRAKTRALTGLAILLTLVQSLWGWASYLPTFFSSYYLHLDEKAQEGSLLIFGLTHGFLWILVLPLYFGSQSAALLMLFTLQELAFKCILTSFSELHPSIARLGLRKVVATQQGLNVQESDIYRFQVSFQKKWCMYKKLHKNVAGPFLVLWFVEGVLVVWSSFSLRDGFEAAISDPRVDRLRDHWELVCRLLWFLGTSIWVGGGCWIVATLPWGANYYSWRMRDLTRQIIITSPKLRHVLVAFLKDFDLDFKVSFLRATLPTLPVFACILALNSLGYCADVVRLLRALWE